MHFLSEAQVSQSLHLQELVSAIHDAFARDFHATLRMPVRTQVDLGRTILLLMPCHDPALNTAGVKMVTVSPQAGVNATYLLLDPASGETLAIMEANYLTDLRTAATSAVATQLLARPDAQVLGIFGSGRQARAHLLVLSQTGKFKRFLVCGSRRSGLTEFCRALKEDWGIIIESVDAATCARESDVLCTCTTSTHPLFDGSVLRPGTHLNLVGAFRSHTREVDDETVKRARVVVDTYEGAMAEAGDLLIPIGKGIIEREHIVADLHEIAGGKKRGRNSPEEITLFKSVGCAMEDLVAAKRVFAFKSRSVARDRYHL